MEKDHVVISLEKYETMRAEPIRVSEGMKELEKQINTLQEVIVNLMKADQYEAHSLFTKARYTVKFTDPKGNHWECGRGNQIIQLNITTK